MWNVVVAGEVVKMSDSRNTDRPTYALQTIRLEQDCLTVVNAMTGDSYRVVIVNGEPQLAKEI